MVLLTAFRTRSAILGRNVSSLGRFIPLTCNGRNEKISLELCQVRYFAARKGTRERKFAAQQAIKLKKAAKEEKTPKYMLKKNKFNTGKEIYRCKDENWPKIVPLDDVYLTKFYRGIPSSLKDAVELLQKLHHPTVLNTPNSFIYATIELDLRMKKKNNHLEEFSGLVSYPNEFETGISNRVIAICKTLEDQAKASDAGAVIVGAGPLIKQISSGELTQEDFDFVICHPDSYKELSVLRGFLKKRYPSIPNGQLRLDVDKAVEIFSKGTTYNSNSSAVEIDFGWVDTCFGRLNMNHDHLEENLRTLLSKIETHKPMGTPDISFITRTFVWTTALNYKIKIPHWEYIPGYKMPEENVDANEDTNEDTKEAVQ